MISSYNVFKRSGQSDLELDALENIAIAYYDLKEYEVAVSYYDLYTKLKTDIDKTTYSNNLKGLETSRNLEKANAEMIQLQQSNEIEELKNKRKTYYISILSGIGLIVVFIAYLLYRRNKLKQDSNKKLQAQNRIILEKTHEIEQSIKYAKGIQTTFLPEKEVLDELLPDNFIYFQPKDIVSGDFYWFKASADKKKILIACADCTGHGVPGALMSMVGINILQQIFSNHKSIAPASILKNLNNEIKHSLKQNTEQNKQRDGMDISLVCFDLETNKLLYSGANRSLFLIKNGELMEIKPNKCAIGGYTEYNAEFEQTEISLDKGDMFVMSTDGYADQFGGKEGKKFMTRNFKSLVQSIHKLNKSEQYYQIRNTFDQWRGGFDQVDDVCVIGVKRN